MEWKKIMAEKKVSAWFLQETRRPCKLFTYKALRLSWKDNAMQKSILLYINILGFIKCTIASLFCYKKVTQVFTSFSWRNVIFRVKRVQSRWKLCQDWMFFPFRWPFFCLWFLYKKSKGKGIFCKEWRFYTPSYYVKYVICLFSESGENTLFDKHTLRHYTEWYLIMNQIRHPQNHYYLWNQSKNTTMTRW